MWPILGLKAYEDALVDGNRTVRFSASLYDKNFAPLGKPLILQGGTVEMDLQSEPMGRASVELIDNANVLPDADNTVWFSWNLKLTVELKVSGNWVERPLFFGPIQDVSRSAKTYSIDADSKEVQHLAPHHFPKPFTVKKHTKLHAAIRDVMSARGETKFDLEHVRRRLHSNRHGWLGIEPWKLAKSFARDADMHLFYRGDGTLKLCSWSTAAAWRFTAGPDGTLVSYPEERASVGAVRDTVVVKGRKTEKVEVTKDSEMDEKSVIGATSIHVKVSPNFVSILEEGMKIKIGGGDQPETRTIAGSYTPGSRTIPLSNALDRNHNVGAPVSVTVKKDKEFSILGRAELGAGHRLSSESLTGGKRPRIEVFERPSIHKKKTAESLADDLLDRISARFEQSIAVSSVPIWHLEVGDIFIVDFRDVEHRSRIQRISYPLTLDGTMEMNWIGERPAPKGKRH